MSSLGIIPIRYQSSRLPNKPFRMAGGKRLIDWTIDVAKQSQLDDIIVVSSSELVHQYCIENHIKCIHRPRGLESDSSPIIDTIAWLNESMYNNTYDIQMLLQITNPTRTVEDIDKCLKSLEVTTVNSVCSVVNVGEFHPARMYLPAVGNGLVPMWTARQWLRTQDLPRVYMRDGCIYAWKTEAFLKSMDTLMPARVLSYEIEFDRSVRIDTESDLARADSLLTHQGAVA